MQDKELFEAIREIFDENIPFNRLLGLNVASLNYDEVMLKFTMHDKLIGNYKRGALHGGVISSVIDVTGGLAAFMGVLRKHPHYNLQQKLEIFSKLGTIDLRVDYLRPGIGKWYISNGYTLRTGKKVAVTRIELKNDNEDLVAVGTGSYVVS